MITIERYELILQAISHQFNVSFRKRVPKTIPTKDWWSPLTQFPVDD